MTALSICGCLTAIMNSPEAVFLIVWPIDRVLERHLGPLCNRQPTAPTPVQLNHEWTDVNLHFGQVPPNDFHTQ